MVQVFITENEDERGKSVSFSVMAKVEAAPACTAFEVCITKTSLRAKQRRDEFVQWLRSINIDATKADAYL